MIHKKVRPATQANFQLLRCFFLMFSSTQNRTQKVCENPFLSFFRDSSCDLQVTLKVHVPGWLGWLGKATRPPGGGIASPGDRRWRQALRPPPLQHLQLLLPLLMPLLEGPGIMALEPCSGVKQGDWPALSKTSSFLLGRSCQSFQLG